MTERSTLYKGGSPTVFALFNESTRRGWGYRRIAAEINVSRGAVMKWRKGTSSPAITSVEAWARALGGYAAFAMPGRALLEGDLLDVLDVVADERGVNATVLADRAGYDRRTLAYGAPRLSTLRDYGMALGLELVWRRV